MASNTIDYDALAKANGATSSATAGGGVDYDALAKQNGATSSQPSASAPQNTRQQLMSEGFLDSAWKGLKSIPTTLYSMATGETAKAHQAEAQQVQDLEKNGTTEQRREWAK